MSGDELRVGQSRAYDDFYSVPSILGRFPWSGNRHRAQWLIYNLFMRKGAKTERIEAIAPPTAVPDTAPMPPILPIKREWRTAVLEAAHGPAAALEAGPGPHLA